MNTLFSDIFWLENTLPLRKREKLRSLFRLLFALALAVLFVLYLLGLIEEYSPLTPSLAIVVGGIWISLVLLESYVNSQMREISLAQLHAGMLAQKSDPDAVLGFVFSETGQKILELAHVPEGAIEAFREARARSLDLAPRVLSIGAGRDLKARVAEMVGGDDRFASFLAVNNVSVETLMLATELFLKDEMIRRMPPKSFFAETALYFSGVGKRWSPGSAPTLHRYAKGIPKMMLLHEGVLHAYVGQLERLASAQRPPKISLKADPEIARELLVLFFSKLKNGPTHALLAERYPLWLDTNMIVGRARDRASLEDMLAHIVDEAIREGIFFLVIEDWALFEKSCATFGVEIRHIFEPLFTSSRVALLVSDFTGAGLLVFDVPIASMSTPLPAPLQAQSPLVTSVS